MGAIRFFRQLGILLVFLFLAAGSLLVHDSFATSGLTQPWDLLGGAFLCSLSAFVGYFLFRRTDAE